ncbi:MAG: AraC family transcriptional regulator [Ferruginibacter sp.]
MKTPFKILFPRAVEFLQKDTLPENCDHKIPFAIPYQSTSDLGDFITQRVNGNDYWMELLTCSVSTNCTIDLSFPDPCIAFAFFLKGSILLGSHHNNQKIFLSSGSFNCYYAPAGDRNFIIPPGEYVILILVPPPNYLLGMAEEHLILQDLLNRLSRKDTNADRLDTFKFPHAVIRIIKSMERCNKKGAALDLVLRSYILKFLSFYNQQLKEKEIHKGFQTNEHIAIAVKEHIMNNISSMHLGRVKELSHQFNITSRSLRREFRKLFGQTVPEFIRAQRLDLAHRLLVNSSKQVQEVAAETGYDFLSHFNREFKRKFGYAPGTLKKISKGNPSY